MRNVRSRPGFSEGNRLQKIVQWMDVQSCSCELDCVVTSCKNLNYNLSETALSATNFAICL